ncbi:S8 family peptidase [Pedobacter sp. Du54]|uniref:S8 family peptidase n=1 Tax=Pedobacter anseongensis TaxID=3133439 RepID=UPI0030A25BBF
MSEFPHLTLKQKLQGSYQFKGVPIDKVVQDQTQANLSNRDSHGNQLSGSASSVKEEHETYLREREKAGLPDIYSKEIFPLLLQIDPLDFDVESLKSFGIEIISEEEDGFIIGSNSDNFKALSEKIAVFIAQETVSKNQAAKLWQIVGGEQWRVEHILSDGLKAKYIAGIADQEILTLDVSVACYVKFDEHPIQVAEEEDGHYENYVKEWKLKNPEPTDKKMRKQTRREPDEKYTKRLEDWEEKTRINHELKDKLMMERQDQLYDFIENAYQGEILSSFVELNDSFGFRASMTGQGFKDFLRAYPYVFEISESEVVQMEKGHDEENIEFDHIEISAPGPDSPVVCIIDSGLQEKHILLEPAILDGLSINYVETEQTTSDLVAKGGHGTKVAGAVLYGEEIPDSGSHATSIFLANARVLNKDNLLPKELYPAELMEFIVDDFDGVKIFNLSINSQVSARTTHMSSWAATLDRLIFERNLLFIVSAGNIPSDSVVPTIPGISNHLNMGRVYPEYLNEASSRIANPGQSLLSLTVGSVCAADFEDDDRVSFGRKNDISSFSRSGPGIWNSVKPDVVELGGDFLREKSSSLLTIHDQVSIRVVKAGPNRTGFGIGTSFATPKVTHIAAMAAKTNPGLSSLEYKALVVQSARLPDPLLYNPTTEVLQRFGYGIPNLNRATQNSKHRITFLATGEVSPYQANLYSLTIPEELRRPGNNFEVMIEITLTYHANPRRTRKKLKSYLSSWLSWESSKKADSFDQFSKRVLKGMGKPEEESTSETTGNIPWVLSHQGNYGVVKDMKRQDSATQKDWAMVASNQLPPELSFAVIGHKGWEKDISQGVPFAIAISFEIIGKEMEIYDQISISNQVDIEVPIVAMER